MKRVTKLMMLNDTTPYYKKILTTQPSNLIGAWLQREESGAVSFDSSAQKNNGVYTGITLGQPGIPGTGMTSAGYNAVTSYNNIYSAGLAADFSGDEGTLLVTAKVTDVGVWTDGGARYLAKLYVDGSNFVQILKEATDNTIGFYYKAGGAQEDKLVGGMLDTEFVCYVITWSKSGDVVKYYIDGDLYGSDTGLGEWAGSLHTAYTVIGSGIATGAAFAIWSGSIAPVALWNKALTAEEVSSLATVFESSPDYFTLGDSTVAITGDPSNRHNFQPVHSTNIEEVNLTIDGVSRKYLAYDCNPEGTEIRLYYSDDLDGQWTGYSGNPILFSETFAIIYRWPSVVWDGTTLHMMLSNRVDKEVQRWTSFDGITFTKQEIIFTTVDTDDQYFGQFCWKNPTDSKWYIYFYVKEDGIRYLYVKSDAALTGLATAVPTSVATTGGDPTLATQMAAQTVLYKDPYYWMLVEHMPTTFWTISAFRSNLPDGNFTKHPTSIILGTAADEQACPIHLFDPTGTSIYLYTSRRHAADMEWYIDQRKISNPIY